ncbi:MAG TPA: hypothetical protein P5218_09450 [Planctomycetota bacterium]|nr:hypothetical protein [Planctomycetota bacterium]HRV81650.1 hypothetical protein [Planctomycetota bacterium]
MKPADTVLAQGSFGNLNPQRTFLAREGIRSEIVCPPGKDPNG